MPPFVSCKNVSVYRANNPILRRSSCVVDGKGLTAVIGPSGCGKSTLLKVMAGLLEPNYGSVEYDLQGQLLSPGSLRQQIGFMVQDDALLDGLSVSENASYYAHIHGVAGKEFRQKFELLCEQLDLKPHAEKDVAVLSGGQRRRANLVCTLVHSPKIVFADEPTTGLDQSSRQLVWNLLEGLEAKKTKVVFTTHYLEEAEASADEVIIMAGGSVAAQGRPPELASGLNARQAVRLVASPGYRLDAERLSRILSKSRGVREFVCTESSVVALSSEPENTLDSLKSAIGSTSLPKVWAGIVEPGLEEVFLLRTAGTQEIKTTSASGE